MSDVDAAVFTPPANSLFTVIVAVDAPPLPLPLLRLTFVSFAAFVVNIKLLLLLVLLLLLLLVVLLPPPPLLLLLTNVVVTVADDVLIGLVLFGT